MKISSFLRSAGSAVAALLIAAAPASAQSGTVYEFLRIPMNARAAALGNTFITATDDAAVAMFNPAGLSSIQHPSASIGFVKYLLDVNAGYASYAQHVDNVGWIGGSVIYMNYGTFDATDKFSTVTGTFGAGDLAVSAGYANAFDRLRIGGAVKFMYSSIAEFSSYGVAVDAGVAYDIPEQQVVCAVSMQNAGVQLKAYNTTKEDLPFDLTIGASKKLEHLPLTVLLNFHKITESSSSLFDHFSKFSIGGEFSLSPNFRARIGYNNEMRRELKIGDSAKLAGFSAGVGITVATYLVDYAFTSFGSIGSLHRFSVGTQF